MTVESKYVIAIATLSVPINPLTAEWALRALIDFTLSNARRFYSSMGNSVDGKRLKDSHQFFNQWEAKPKPIAPCTRHFSRASRELQVIARNCDLFMALFVPVVMGRSDCFGFGFSTVIWKPL